MRWDESLENREFASRCDQRVGSEVWNRVYMIASVKKFGLVRLSTNFLQNKYGGEGRHGTAQNTFFSLFCLKKGWRNLKFSTKTMDQPLLKNISFWTFLNWCFCSLVWIVFYLRRHQQLFFSLFCLKRKDQEHFHQTMD